jgi:predicted dehydrogenase
VAAVITQFEGGAVGYLGSSWVSPGIYWIHIYGTEANLYQEH